MIAPGTIIDDRYRVISRLGSGGMADVYLAHDQLLGRQVAVKVLHAHFAEDQEFVERFRREASSAAALSHPNIVGIFDRGEWDGTYYIAMEYVEGRTLKKIVEEHGALDVVLAIDLALQILQAARFAHSRGVIHRDLKPQNVIVDEEGRARVTDFGIARAGASEMTMTGSVLGTAQYLSPEQAQGYPVTEASDIYSTGVILYELLTGVLPFEGETPVAIAFKQVAAEPVPPSRINPVVPTTLDAIVLKALAKEPAERFTTDESFSAALQLERERLTSVGGPTDMTAVAAAVPFAMAAAPGGSNGGNGGDGDEEEEDDEGSRRALWWTLGILAAVAIAVVLFLLLSGKNKVTVPSVVGQSEQVAIATLRGDNFEVSTTEIHSQSPAKSVVRQSPSGGSSAEKGSRVELEISSGPSAVDVPEVVGEKEAVAIAKLEKAHFETKVKLEPSPTVPSGRVISTTPSAGRAREGRQHGRPGGLHRRRKRSRPERHRLLPGGGRNRAPERETEGRERHQANLQRIAGDRDRAVAGRGDSAQGRRTRRTGHRAGGERGDGAERRRHGTGSGRRTAQGRRPQGHVAAYPDARTRKTSAACSRRARPAATRRPKAAPWCSK